jgi:hypothetical protein
VVKRQKRAVFDDDANTDVVVVYGWDGPRRVHGCLAHLEIIDDKIWIYQDGTEYGLANELLAAGVPKDKIVLGWKSPWMRQHTRFAVA